MKYEQDLKKAVCMKTGIASPVVVKNRSIMPKFCKIQKVIKLNNLVDLEIK